MVHESYQAVAEKSHQVMRWYEAPGGNLGKTVGVAYLRNQSGYLVPDFESTYTTELIERLRAEGGELRILSPQDPAAPEMLRRVPLNPNGGIDNFDLALKARQNAINAVVVATLIDVRDRRQEKGLWWFKDVYDYIDVTLDIEVYDSETAAKLLDERLIHSFEADMPLHSSNQPASQTLPAQVLEELSSILPRAARMIADAAVVHPWVGFIREVSQRRVILSAGADSGLQAGDVLEVFDNSRIIQGANEIHYFVPGLKIGEIEVTAPSAGGVEARILSDGPIWVGCSVKLKE